MIRRFLDTLYLASGVLAGVFLAGIAVTIILQIAGRFAGLTIDSTESAGFCMAASSFLGLAYALKSGEHIRVNLLIRYLSPGARRLIELWCCAFGAVGMAIFAWWAFDLVWQSYTFGDLSPGLLAMPFWIPQLGMAVGASLMVVAFVDEFVCILAGLIPAYERNDPTAAAMAAAEADGAQMRLAAE